MGYLIAQLSILALLASFFALFVYEKKHMTRFFPGLRRSLDRRATTAHFIFTRVDFSALVRESVQSLFESIIHEGARAALAATHFIERHLTQIVERFRTRFTEHRTPPDPAKVSPFARTLSEFKKSLRTDAPKDTDHLS